MSFHKNIKPRDHCNYIVNSTNLLGADLFYERKLSKYQAHYLNVHKNIFAVY